MVENFMGHGRPKTNRSGHKGSVITGAKSGGLVPTTVKRRREPERLRARANPVATEVDTAMTGATEPNLDLAGYTPTVRAVLGAKPSTCRFPVTQVAADFAFCGKPATVVAAGRFTYCAGCARRMQPGHIGSEVGRYSRTPLPSAAWAPPRPKP